MCISFLGVAAGSPAAAAGLARLTGCWGDGGPSLTCHGEIDLWRYDTGGLCLSFTLPGELTSEDEAYASLVWSNRGGGWRWTAAGRTGRTSTQCTDGLRISGSYSNNYWRCGGAVFGEWERGSPDQEWGVECTAVRTFDARHRLALRQEFADVTIYNGGDHYCRYEVEAALTLGRADRRCDLRVGGSSRRDDQPIDDERTIYAEAEWRLGFGGGWKTGGRVRLADIRGAEAGREWGLDLNVARRSFLVVEGRLSLQSEGGPPEARAGISVSGDSDGGFAWRAGLAGDEWAIWSYLVVDWTRGPWRVAMGLTPSGEYAQNSRQGYWMTLAYKF